MLPDLGAFLEVAVGINVLSQWKAVYTVVAKLYGGTVPLTDEVALVLGKRERWLNRIWMLARVIALPSAALAYLGLLWGVPQGWAPWFAPAVGLPVPIIMLAVLPLVANAFGLRARYVSRRAARRAEQAERVEQEFQKRFQAKLEEMVEKGEISMKSQVPPKSPS